MEESPIALLRLAANASFEYVETIRDRRTVPDEAALAALATIDEPLGRVGAPPRDVLGWLATVGAQVTSASTGGRYFGFVNGGALPVGIAAKWMATVWDQNAALHVMSPLAAKLETVCERWLVDLLGLPSTTVAGFVGGTATASLCGLAAGRDALLRALGWSVDSDGLFGAPPLRVILPDQAHSTVYKALRLLGMGKHQFHMVPTDRQGRMDVTRMPRLGADCLVIAQAGNVNTGAFDDLHTIGTAANDAGAWLHVDGAFGLWAAACAATRHLTQGIDLAHSWAADAHKTLNAPYDSGVVFCRHADALTSALRTHAAYMGTAGVRDGMHLSLDMSRRARSIELWAILKSLGREGVDRLVEQLCRRAQSVAVGLRAAGFHVVNDVVFNQVLVMASTPEETESVLQSLQRRGIVWCGGTLWDSRPAIRVSVCSWQTTPADVDVLVGEFIAAREAARP
jgi:glutamate/tyrosine decarboxylase-like PLP-dependent enzyme